MVINFNILYHLPGAAEPRYVERRFGILADSRQRELDCHEKPVRQDEQEPGNKTECTFEAIHTRDFFPDIEPLCRPKR